MSFWSTQPVPHAPPPSTANNPIQPPPTEIPKEAWPLGQQCEWTEINIDTQAQEVEKMLAENYVEDQDAQFRLTYPANFLLWALKPPNYRPSWHIGVRLTSNQKLVAFIAGIPVTTRIHDHEQEMAEINFLCIHKKLRAKRLAPLLIREVTRRIHLEGIFQAVYTAGLVLPRPISECQYWHRSLNIRKLVDTGFSAVPYGGMIANMERRYAVAKKPTLNVRPFEAKDASQVASKLNAYLIKRAKLVQIFSEAEVIHWLTPRKDVISCYVVEDTKTHQITDMFSYYNLPSTVMRHPVHSQIRAAYLFYYFVSEEASNEIDRYTSLMQDALIAAKQDGYDVFNCLNMLRNSPDILKTLHFGPGDGKLRYYMYNWATRDLFPEEIGLVLL